MSFAWNARREQAAEMVAAGRLSYPDIGKELGVSEKSIDRWKRDPEFRARVQQHLDLARKSIAKSGLARREERIAHKKTRHALLRRVIAARHNDPEMKDVPGGKTGLLVRQWKGKDADTPEYHVDTGTLAELDQLEQDIAIECGDWKQKIEHTGADGGPIEQLIGLANVPTEDLATLHKILSKAQGEK